MANPFVEGPSTAEASADNDLETFQEYAWDFDHDCFILENGKPKIVTENEAMKVWIYKTLRTERWRYRAYDDAYGIELEQFIGATPNTKDNSTEVQRYIKEALLINPYIKSIDKVTFTNDSDVLEFSISLTTVYGKMEVSFS